MSLKRFATRRDSTERAIVEALRAVGAQVIQLDHFDLLVRWRGQLFMLDAKGTRGTATDRQARLIADGWPLTFVRTPEEALHAIGAAK